MGYICCLWGFIEPSKNLGGKYEQSEKFRGQKQTLFELKSQSNAQIASLLREEELKWYQRFKA
jgi:hypothetical protein